MVCKREARLSGRPGDKYTLRFMEAGPCRKPSCIEPGSPTLREAHYQDLRRHEKGGLGRRPYCVYIGSPTEREA